MKKSKVLATTTLAGALLFTGVGATHHANAAEGLTDTQKQNIVNQYIKDNNINATPDSRVASGLTLGNVPEGYTPVGFGEKHAQAPSFVYVNDKTGEIIDRGVGHHELISQDNESNNETSQNTVNKADNTTTQDTTNNNTQSADNTQAVTNNETTNNTTAATDNNVSTQENNTQSTQSNEAQTLPETGGQSNAGLVTIIASVLLAAGSLLAFRRTSNSK
ncbi:LPXTG cell wall anchor domain-containing protein [Staphylococcus hominis]